MISVRSKYTGGIVSIPTIFVALCWVAIWFLWGSVDMPSSLSGNEPVSCNMTYSGFGADTGVAGGRRYYPDGFGPIQTAVSVFDDSSMDVVSAGPAGVVSGTMPFIRMDAGQNRKILPFDAPLSLSAEEAAGGYRHISGDRVVFGGSPLPSAVIKIEVPDNLKKAGFSVPQAAVDLVRKVDRPWQVTLHVEFDGLGRPLDVFVLAGSGDREIDRDIIKMIYSSGVDAGLSGCRGQLLVGYNGKAEPTESGGDAGTTAL